MKQSMNSGFAHMFEHSRTTSACSSSVTPFPMHTNHALITTSSSLIALSGVIVLISTIIIL